MAPIEDPAEEVGYTPARGSFVHADRKLPFQCRETDEAYEFRCVLPGGCEDGISIDVQGTELTVEVIRDEDGATWTHRWFLLESVRARSAAALVDDGVLKLRLPKARPRPQLRTNRSEG